MENKEWTFKDKSNWQRGEWDNEPDKVQFVTKAGLPGLIVRGPVGALCGYVGIAEGHPLYGIGYSQCTKQPPCEELYCDHSPEYQLSVHGGITFADFCAEGESKEHGICHIPSEGEPDKVWWFGFDCSHCDDLAPSYDHQIQWSIPRQYRNLAYVKQEIENLAVQLS